MAVDPSAEYGRAWIDPDGPVPAGTVGTWTVTYEAGARAIAPGGRVGIAWLWPSDWGRPQFTRPSGPDYATLATTGACQLRGSFEGSVFIHPWDHVTVVEVSGAALNPGEKVALTYGDTTGASPGSRAQTFRESHCGFRVIVDPDATGRWVPLLSYPTIQVTGGPAERLVVVAASDVVVGEPFVVSVRAEDHWNNPSPGYRGHVHLVMPDGSPGPSHRFGPSDDGVARLHLSLSQPGRYRLVVHDDGGLSAESNPVTCRAVAPMYRRYFGDVHCGQSRAGCGAGTVEEHFRFLRDVAAADFGTHQGNCFMVSTADWAETCRVSREMNQDGRFVALLGYEWSGESSVGGDRNVLFLDDDQPIRRCSHELLADRSDESTDLPHVEDAFRHYAGKRALLVPHVGGRTSDLRFHDPALEPVIEIHSGHATSEWFLFEALERGYRVGVTGGADDIMGRPGASYPGFTRGRNTRGGLAGVYATALTREALFEALRSRRTYATTGDRIVLWVEADGRPMGAEYATTAPPSIHCDVIGTASLERVELFRGASVIFAAPVVDTTRPRERTVRIAWSGATVRGTGSYAKLAWDGHLTIDRGAFSAVRPFGFDGASDAILESGDRLIRWRSITALDRDGLVVEYDAPEDAILTFHSPVTTFTVRPADVDSGSLVVDAGPVDRKVVVSRLPLLPGPRQFSFDFVDEQAPSGLSAYFVRVVQDDDEKAWSSPIYVSRL